MPYLLIADEGIPVLDIRAGDEVLVDADTPEPLPLCRELAADYADLGRALAAGQLRRE
jgi:hypothetical protein